MDQQPQQPLQAPTQVPSQPQDVPSGQPTPQPPKKSNKSAIIAGIISLVVIALIAFFVWSFASGATISADDYKQASADSIALQDAYAKVYDRTYEKLPDMIIGYDSNSDDPAVKEIKNLFEDYSQKSDAFLKLNALKDKDIKNEHKQFFEKSEQFDVFMNGLFDSVAALKKTDTCATAEMTDYTDKTALVVFDKAFEPCFAALDELIDSKNTVIAKYNTAVKKNLTNLRDLHEDIQNAALAGDADAQMEASNKILKLNPETVMQGADEAMLDGIDAIDMSSQLKSLQEALNSKAQSNS